MEKLFELTFQDQTLNPQVGTFTDASQTTGTFTLEGGEYYLTNGDTKGFYAYAPVAIQPDSETDNKVTVEFDLKVATASVNTHTIIGTYAGVDGSGIPTGAKITLQYNAGDIELVLGSGATATLIAAADVVVDQWYHFRIDCALDAPTESTYQVKIDGTAVTTVTGATTDYALGVISVLGTDLHACDECGIKNITFVTETNLYVGRTALDQVLRDVKGIFAPKSDIPTVNNGTLTIQQNGTTLGTFTANASTDKTINISTADDTKIPLAGSNAISGDLIPATDNSIDVGSSTKNIKMLYTKGITIDGTQFLPSDYIPRLGGPVLAGQTLFRTTPNSYILFGGGTTWYDGASIVVYGKDDPDQSSAVRFHPSNGLVLKDMYLYPDGTWTWQGSAVQLVSDQRLKQQISEIDDKLLDAWEDVNLVQFKYNDAVDAKKDKARLHTGYVVQQIDKACKEHGVDISAYGLYCHEEYPEETREVEQADGTKTIEVVRPASEHYSLRYTEVYAVECMYLRRCIARLTARIEQLEKGKEQEASK